MKTTAWTVAAVVLLWETSGLAAPLPPGRPKVRAVLEGHLNLWDLAFGPDGKMLASAGGGDGTARVWHLSDGTCFSVLKGQVSFIGSSRPFVRGVAFNPDGRLLATCGGDGTVKLWIVGIGQCVATFRHRGIVDAVAFDPEGKRFAALNSGGVHLWSLQTEKPWTYQTEKPEAVYEDMTGMWRSLAFAPNGKLLFASADPVGNARDLPTLRIWDPETNKLAFQLQGRERRAFSALAFSPDGKTLATGGRACPVQLWDVATGKNTATFADRPGGICALTFSPNGKILAAGFKYMDGDADANPSCAAVRLYEPATGKVLATLKKGKPGPSHPIAFSSDGRMIATGDRDGKIILWDLPATYADE